MTADGDRDEVVLRYRARLEEIEAEYQADIREYETWWSRPRREMYVPLGPEQAAQKRDQAVANARAEYGSALELYALEQRVGAEQHTEQQAEPHTGGARSRVKGGRPRKRHPGLALREAARIIAVNETGSANEIADTVTKKVRGKLKEDELVAYNWEVGFSWDDAALMQRAVEAKLVKWTPGDGLQVREKPTGVFRRVDDLEWLVTPDPG